MAHSLCKEQKQCQILSTLLTIREEWSLGHFKAATIKSFCHLHLAKHFLHFERLSCSETNLATRLKSASSLRGQHSDKTQNNLHRANYTKLITTSKEKKSCTVQQWQNIRMLSVMWAGCVSVCKCQCGCVCWHKRKYYPHHKEASLHLGQPFPECLGPPPCEASLRTVMAGSI